MIKIWSSQGNLILDLFLNAIAFRNSFIYTSHTSPIEFHQSTLESVSAAGLGNRKSQSAPPFFSRCYEKKGLYISSTLKF